MLKHWNQFCWENKFQRQVIISLKMFTYVSNRYYWVNTADLRLCSTYKMVLWSTETGKVVLLVIYFFNFCTVYIFYVSVEMICLVYLYPTLKKPFSFFLFSTAPREAFSLWCSAFVTGVSEKLWLWHCYKGQSYKGQT